MHDKRLNTADRWVPTAAVPPLLHDALSALDARSRGPRPTCERHVPARVAIPQPAFHRLPGPRRCLPRALASHCER